MRRLHNAIAATLLLFGIIYLCTPRESGLSDQISSYLSNGAHGGVPLHEGHEGKRPHNGLQAPAHSSNTPYPSTSDHSSVIDDDRSPIGFDVQNPQSEGFQSSHEDSALPPTDGPRPQPSSEATVAKPEFTFQNDLDVEFPFDTLKHFSHHAPLHYNPQAPKTYAYATFMATRNPSLKDPYFLAILSVMHRILWSPRSKTQKAHPFIVFVASFVTEEQRDVLRGAGAIVRELAPLEWSCDKPGVQSRWKDLFAKLNMWAETDFSRIIFLDADAFPVANIDDMFDVAQVQKCRRDKLELSDHLTESFEPVCEDYVFAGVPQSYGNPTDLNINVGSMIFSPSTIQHQRLIQNYRKTDKYDCAMAEQAFLNWQFNPMGSHPPTSLDRKWGGFFPKETDEGMLKVVHEKLWSENIAEESGMWLKHEWERGWGEMVGWYQSREFEVERGRVGLLGSGRL
jgi:inositol 3-alpha-galactosyltransferase